MAADSGGAMNLGAHLEELRWRLFKGLFVTIAIMAIGFFFRAELMAIAEWPMRRSFTLVEPEVLRAIVIDPENMVFRIDDAVEGAINVLKVCFFAGLVLGFPVWVYQLWCFVTPGLHSHERRLGFLLVPAGVMFFYGGLLLGYFYGLPYFYKFMHEFNAEGNVRMELYQGRYLSFFFTMTLVFGFVMDIPWAILVLVRLGLVTPRFLAEKRKIILMIGALVAAVLTPPDPYSQMMMLIVMVVLFELGLAASRLVHRPVRTASAASTGTPRPPLGGGDGLLGGMLDLPPRPPVLPSAPAEPEVPTDEDDDSAAFADLDVTSSTPIDPYLQGRVARDAPPPADPLEAPPAAAPPAPADPWLHGRKRRDFITDDDAPPPSAEPEDGIDSSKPERP